MTWFDFILEDGSGEEEKISIRRDLCDVEEARAVAMTLLPSPKDLSTMEVGGYYSFVATIKNCDDKIVGRFIMAIMADTVEPNRDRIFQSVN